MYVYSCARNHITENEYPMGEAESSVVCKCGGIANRDYAAVQIVNDDSFRRYHLSTKKESEAVRQQRVIDGPTDKFEARRMERELGRTYIGDDASLLRPAGQRAVESHKDRVKSGQVKA